MLECLSKYRICGAVSIRSDFAADQTMWPPISATFLALWAKCQWPSWCLASSARISPVSAKPSTLRASATPCQTQDGSRDRRTSTPLISFRLSPKDSTKLEGPPTNPSKLASDSDSGHQLRYTFGYFSSRSKSTLVFVAARVLCMVMPRFLPPSSRRAGPCHFTLGSAHFSVSSRRVPCSDAAHVSSHA